MIRSLLSIFLCRCGIVPPVFATVFAALLLAGCAVQDFDPATAVLPANRLASDAALEVHVVASFAPGAPDTVPGNRNWIEYNIKLVNLTRGTLILEALELRTEGGGSESPGAPGEVSETGANEARQRMLFPGRKIGANAAAAGSAFFLGSAKPESLVVSYRSGSRRGKVTVDLRPQPGEGRTGVKAVKPAS